MNQKNGFTLVELAIALMVIGLLIGGVLKGQELIENARITRFTKDINDYDAATMIFRSIYDGYLPGDFPNAATRLPNCSTAPCNSFDSQHSGDYKLLLTIEMGNFWRHLHRANLISYINESGWSASVGPVDPWGRHHIVPSFLNNATPIGNHFRRLLVDSDTQHSYSYRYSNPINLVIKIDTKMDDGKPFTGSVQIMQESQALACTNSTTEEYQPPPVTNMSGCGFSIATPSLN